MGRAILSREELLLPIRVMHGGKFVTLKKILVYSFAIL